MQPAFQSDVPYVLGVVKLDEDDGDEGLRMITNIIGCKPEDVKVGVVFDDVTNEWTLAKFKPVS